MPDSDHRSDATPAPAAAPADVEPAPAPAPTAARDRSLERLAGRVAGAAIAAVTVGAEVADSTARGAAHGARDAATAVGEGFDGAAGMVGVPGAATRAVRLAQARREWTAAFEQRHGDDLVARVAAGTADAVTQASPGILAGPLGPEAVALVEAVPSAGVAATEAREHGATRLRADPRGLAAGVAAAATVRGADALPPVGVGGAPLRDLSTRIAAEPSALASAAPTFVHDPSPALRAAGDAALDAGKAGARDAATRWVRAQAQPDGHENP